MALTSAILLLTACGASGASGGRGGSSKRSDSSLACDHFRNIAHDASAGLLTHSELRDKLEEVYSDASIATSRVLNASQTMLAAATADDLSRLTQAVHQMDSACSATGH